MQTGQTSGQKQKKSAPIKFNKQIETGPPSKSREEILRERKDEQSMESEERGVAHVMAAAKDKRTHEAERSKTKADLSKKNRASQTDTNSRH